MLPAAIQGAKELWTLRPLPLTNQMMPSTSSNCWLTQTHECTHWLQTDSCLEHLISGQRALLASNVFVMTAVTAESPQPQFRASPHASWLPRLHLFFAVVLWAMQVCNTWVMPKLILLPLQRRQFSQSLQIFLHGHKVSLCSFNWYRHCKKEEKAWKSEIKRWDHLAQGNSHIEHYHCSSQPFRNAKELKLFAPFNLRP